MLLVLLTNHLFLIPTTAYITPVISNIAPDKPMAGVTFGDIGNGGAVAEAEAEVAAALSVLFLSSSGEQHY